MTIRKPTTEQLDTAIAWLRCNSGEEGESDRCRAVADYLEAIETDEHVKRAAREGGVPVAKLRKRLAALGGPHGR